ncbi:hypothetical protein LTR56_011370 [Elasticomyces elasticus]|nr:hypothetical protein LTR56_011370 [Elasticomyces elasticus]KAK3660972.1 hypothetical protein LTR22_007800 [Elasticomyces elasticus]KAK4932379.1 hypothetical protein LTR49_001248 [Elasticomyces elasticus]KAK5768387.1 hypothetical protein LTS12_001526 [Elasticomyces elasticus]
MALRAAYPPIFHHFSLTTRLTPLETQVQLSTFLSLTQNSPYLHPDAQLSTSGITFAAQSGPKGGIALHHLRRIEAGLRGERLGLETAAELEEEYGTEAGKPESDDRHLDTLIAGTAANGSGGGLLKGVLKRKRTTDWAESTLTNAGEGDSHEPLNDYEDKESYELSQRNAVGEVGDRGDHVVKQNGAPPVVQHVMTEADKKARRAAKKQKNKAESADKLKEKREREAKG